MHCYKIDDGETWWVVAENDEAAVDMVRESMGMTREEFMSDHMCDEDPDVVQMRPDENLELTTEDVPSTVFRELTADLAPGINVYVKLSGPVSAWIESNGPGILGATVW